MYRFAGAIELIQIFSVKFNIILVICLVYDDYLLHRPSVFRSLTFCVTSLQFFHHVPNIRNEPFFLILTVTCRLGVGSLNTNQHFKIFYLKLVFEGVTCPRKSLTLFSKPYRVVLKSYVHPLLPFINIQFWSKFTLYKMAISSFLLNLRQYT